MEHDLTGHLNAHLAGSSGALELIQKIIDGHIAPEARDFFLHLRKMVEADRSLLRELLERIGQEAGGLQKVAGGIATRIADIKLVWRQVEPGMPGLRDAVELLALGVQGKRLLWVALREIAAWIPEWNGIDFQELELQAIKQRENLELWRAGAPM